MKSQIADKITWTYRSIQRLQSIITELGYLSDHLSNHQAAAIRDAIVLHEGVMLDLIASEREPDEEDV